MLARGGAAELKDYWVGEADQAPNGPTAPFSAPVPLGLWYDAVSTGVSIQHSEHVPCSISSMAARA